MLILYVNVSGNINLKKRNELLYNVVLVSAVQKSESAIRGHRFPLFWVSFPFRSPGNTELSELSR